MILPGFRRLWTSRALLIDQCENDNDKKIEPQQESDEEYDKNIKTKILDASLKFVPEMGWSKQAISAGNSIYNSSYVLCCSFKKISYLIILSSKLD